ncbi:MAG TPA: M1 family metallopeptidase [Bryobacteraceae bacterium]|nr:M1 family metallopeptidase [Bryobacteraceae bacterium]
MQPQDRHSFATPLEVRTKHLDLDLEVLFEQKILRGTATHTVVRTDEDAPLVLDTRDLTITKVETAESADKPFTPAKFEVAPKDPILGAALKIPLPSGATLVRVHYATSPAASGLQWLEPAQTSGKQKPFLYTQSQAIHARSWIPLQDSPGVRITYRARIRTPKDLIAVMSARSDFRLANPKEPPHGDYSFRLPQAIPSYLIALAVGEIEFRYLSSRSGVWAEPGVVERAAKELADTERMIQAAEKLFGPYAWYRYDILILPPSFPFGGMENPLMTFATPTILAGDKSLVSLIAHELAHSWSGNLVTNASWSDFWLNEGFTTYFERRILEEVYGPKRARMEAVLGRQSLVEELKTLPQKDQILHIDLSGRDPDEGATNVPYEKGALFLTALEGAVGRERFDAFLNAYFRRFSFESITTSQFRNFLNKNMPPTQVPVEEWLTMPGLPASAPKPVSDTFQGEPSLQWNTHQWLHFLRSFPPGIGAAKMAQLDRLYHFTRSTNYEILFEWLRMAVVNRYAAAYPKLEESLVAVGRRKYLKPIYEELAKTAEGMAMAKRIYEAARPGYHPITAATIDAILRK